MIDDFEVSQGKSIGDLWAEAAWFVSHTAFSSRVSAERKTVRADGAASFTTMTNQY